MESVEELINQFTTYPILGFIGEARVNVLKLNIALDALE
jgi:K+-transporting ATPase c subunit